MVPFKFQLPTHVYFGPDEEQNAGAYIRENGGSTVLFHYGRSSIKKSGLYDRIVSSLRAAGLSYIELGGVEANPEITLVRKGVALCREAGVDFILAVGGGSVIDSAKSIAHGVFYEGDPFDFNRKIATPGKALPVGVVLTISAAGSEMSNSCVISDDACHLKRGFNAETNRPVFAIENPLLTRSVPMEQTAYGIVDMFSHTFERYFSASGPLEFADYLSEGVMRSIIDAGERVKLDPDNYDARATLMVASSYSHNGLTGLGKQVAFPIHQLEHEVSGLRRDIAHGAGLACLIPAWMKVVLDEETEKLASFATHVMHAEAGENDRETALRGIALLEEFFRSLGIPVRLSAYGMTESDIETMLQTLANPVKAKIPLTRDLAKEIYLLAL